VVNAFIKPKWSLAMAALVRAARDAHNAQRQCVTWRSGRNPIDPTGAAFAAATTSVSPPLGDHNSNQILAIQVNPGGMPKTPRRRE